MYCASKGNNTALQVLLNAGADIHARDKTGLSAMHHACKTQNLDTVCFMLKENSIFANQIEY